MSEKMTLKFVGAYMGHDIIDILNRVKVALLFWKTPFKMHDQSLLNRPVCACFGNRD